LILLALMLTVFSTRAWTHPVNKNILYLPYRLKRPVRLPFRLGPALDIPRANSSQAGPLGHNRKGHVPDYAFAFDIDGVLMLGSNPILAGKRALKVLHERQIPYILLTNGGGKWEPDRVAELSRHLGVNVHLFDSTLTVRFLSINSFNHTHHTRTLPTNIRTSLSSQMMTLNAGLLPNATGSKTSGRRRMSMQTFRIFGLLETTIPKTLKSSRQINLLMQL
jgi:hypothetical protein